MWITDFSKKFLKRLKIFSRIFHKNPAFFGEKSVKTAIKIPKRLKIFYVTQKVT